VKGREILLGTFVVCGLLLVVVVGLAYAQDPEPQPRTLAQGTPLGTGFTYQGQLKRDGEPVDDECWFAFRLYDDPGGENQVGEAITTTTPISVTEGLFTTGLDFGPDAFTGDARWLGIRVKCSADVEYADLGRQPLTAAPYATYARSTGALHGYPLTTTQPVTGQVLEWDGAAWGPALDDSSTYTAGNQLDLVGTAFDVVEGSGSDLDADLLDGQDGAFYLDWTNLVGIPPDLADGDDVVTYTAGTGLDLTGTTFSITPTYRLPQSCTGGQVVVWDDVVWACTDVAGGDVTGVYAGPGLSGGGASGEVTLTVAFSGTGSSTYVSRADHDHDTIYTVIGHAHPGSDITSPVATATLAFSATMAPWSGLSDVPAGFADGVDDDTTYTAGTGLDLTATTFSITPTYRLPQTCTGGQIAEWDGSAWACGDDDDTTAFWSLTGNAATTPTIHFLGTTDGVSLTLAVSGTAALRLEPNLTSPNLIGGHSGNWVTAGSSGATIGGGGRSGSSNRVTGSWGTVGGGYDNQAGPLATVGGGRYNTASGNQATVGGGRRNISNNYYTTVGGGSYNTASGNYATVSGGFTDSAAGDYATVGGGQVNTAGGDHATVSGGQSNTASGDYATVGGGNQNSANHYGATVGGGELNTIGGVNATIAGGSSNNASGGATVGGGFDNTASGIFVTVGGGEDNTASGAYATVGGGERNTASGERATVSGGQSNTASGAYATVGGGYLNTASGDRATIPGGYRAAAPHYGEMAYASGQFSARGDAQTSLYVMRNTSSGTDWTDLFLDGTGANLTIAVSRTVTFDILVVGSTQAGESAGYQVYGVVENAGGTTALIATPAVTPLGEDDADWDVQVVADDTNDVLLVQVRGNGESVRWVATVRTVEVTW
jgi:hypothetical protein